MKKVNILTGDPVVACIADMALDEEGIVEMVEWVRSRRPECLPTDFDSYESAANKAATLFPHSRAENGRQLTDNELLVELAGRKCYDSFGLKAGRKTNSEYIANTQAYDPPHASILYHAKMTFFFAGVSRRVSHELIRNYVGADRNEEGSPSQESTRYVEHAGCFIAHPWIVDDEQELELFREHCQQNYDSYLAYVERQHRMILDKTGQQPKGIHRKRILESASPLLAHTCETSWVWTTNPLAIAKLMKERDNDAADLEFRRFARVWKKLCVERWPNLFPQLWMKS